MLFNNRSNLLSAIIFLAGFRTSSAACTTMSSCSGSGTSRFDYGNSFSYNGNTYYCCNSNGDMCTSSSTESECPTPTSYPSPSPSPPPPPSPPPTLSADTSKNCKCSCCKGNYCSASIVASYDANSYSECDASSCRSKFPTSCPASGESGSVSASYTATSSTSTASSQISLPTGTKLYKSSPSSGSGCADLDETCSCSSSYTVLRVSDTNYRFTSNFDPSTEPSCPTGYQCYVLEISGTLNGNKDVLSGTGVMGGQNIGQASIARMGADTYTTFAGSCTYTYSTNKPGASTSSASSIVKSYASIAMVGMTLMLTF